MCSLLLLFLASCDTCRRVDFVSRRVSSFVVLFLLSLCVYIPVYRNRVGVHQKNKRVHGTRYSYTPVDILCTF
jgi:hypothetical protein